MNNWSRKSGARVDIKERFYSFIDWSATSVGDTCWNWIGTLNPTMAYGYFYYEGKRLRAHRFSFAFHVGPITKGLLVLHKCDNPSCVNPAHLYLGTSQDNSNDKMLRGRDNKEKGVDRWSAKLTENDVRAMRIDYVSHKFGCKQLGKKYGVHPSIAWKIVNNKSWTHLK